MVVTRSMSKTDTIVTTSVPKTDPKIAEQTEKEKMVAFAKSNWKLPKSAKIIGKTSSGEPIRRRKWTIETDAMFLFMEKDYLKRYYGNNPPCTSGPIPKEVNCAGQLEWRSLSASEKASWIAKVNKTDTMVTRSVPKTDTIVTRPVPKTDPKIAEQTEKEKMVAFAKSNWKLPKSAKIIGKTSSGEPIRRRNWTIETDAMFFFMENDYLKRYYGNNPPCTSGPIPKEVNCAGQLEWRSLSASEKASWIAKVNKTDTMVTRSVPKTDTIVTRPVPKTDPKIAEQTEKEKMVAFAKSNWKLPKSAKIIGKTSSGEPIRRRNWTIETDAMFFFMENDYLKRYYGNNPPCTSGPIPKEVNCAGQLEWRSLSASEKASWIAKVNKTDTMVTRSVPKTDTIVTRPVPKTDPKIAEQTEKEKMVAFAKSNWKLPKSAKIIGKTSSGEPIRRRKWTIETDAMFFFMENDYLKRYYGNNPPCTSGPIPKEVNCAGQLEWRSLSASEKASWIAKFKNTRADALAARSDQIS